ncbi:hypothetical protein K4F52_003334 [Lecanicillium sp. MT-2017a]|nr:hypothetical protein K4F52_003334 [Lecanicillium sp. MT-2017a]
MKATYAAFLAAVAVDQASATFGIIGGGLKYWKGIGGYKCPSKTPIICEKDQIPGYDWVTVPIGQIGNYGGCNFKGWTCQNELNRRDHPLAARTFGGKSIVGDCGADDENDNPTISAGDDIGSFSIDSYSVTPEVDARLDFHYTMPDGSSCKHSSSCSSQGTTVVNSQCGGAKKVRVVFPKQKTKLLKKLCKVKIHKIKFHCKPKPIASTTLIKTTPVKQTTPPAQETTTTVPAQETTPTVPAQETTTTPAQQTTTEVVVSTPGESTKPAESTPAESTAPGTTVQTTSVVVTTYETTSTVFTTSVQTITSCEPTITECPIKTPGGTHVVTVTIPVSTTICPVTETQTRTKVIVTSKKPEPTKVPGTSEAQSNTEVKTESKPETQNESKTIVPPTTTDKAIETTSAVVVPTESLPCPTEVPKCLNTWLHVVKECKSNADAACFCKSKEFVENIFNCLYSFGQNDKTVADSISFFQGICAPYVKENPCIATGAETITKIITVTPSAMPTADVTTIVVDTTVTEPCVTEGTTIPGSSTTRVISTQYTVPQVTFAPPPAQEEPTQPPAEQPAESGNEPVQPQPTNGVPQDTAVVSVPPVGTGNLPAPTGTAPPVVTGAAAHVHAGMGLGLAVMAAVAAL